MTSEEFYEFCKKRSNNGGEAHKEVALLIVWSFLWEQYRTKEEIEQFLDAHISEQGRKQESSLITAYSWLKGVLTEGANA